jgi:hypothetical protein
VAAAHSGCNSLHGEDKTYCTYSLDFFSFRNLLIAFRIYSARKCGKRKNTVEYTYHHLYHEKLLSVLTPYYGSRIYSARKCGKRKNTEPQLGNEREKERKSTSSREKERGGSTCTECFISVESFACFPFRPSERLLFLRVACKYPTYQSPAFHPNQSSPARDSSNTCPTCSAWLLKVVLLLDRCFHVHHRPQTRFELCNGLMHCTITAGTGIACCFSIGLSPIAPTCSLLTVCANT